MNRPAPRNQYGPPYRRYVRDIPTTDSIPDITLDSRIAGKMLPCNLILTMQRQTHSYYQQRTFSCLF